MADKKILLVEDNPDDEALTIRAFRKANVANEIVVAHDGLEALDYLFGTGQYAGRDVAERPAVILLDLKLPKLDGIEVLRRLRADPRTATNPVVILTISRQEQDLMNGYKMGVNSYICKPVNFDRFLSAAQQIGPYWLVLNEPPPK